MREWFRRVLARPAAEAGKHALALEAGGRGRRWQTGAEVTNLQADIRTSGALIARRAQFYVQNNCHAAAAVRGLVANIIGPGIKPLSRHPQKSLRERLHQRWGLWIDECDVTDNSDFYGLQALVARMMAVDGEAFVRFTTGADGFPRLQVLHADQVTRDQAPVGAPDGIEHDKWGAPVAYHVLPRRTSDWQQFPAPQQTPVRLAARDVAHIFDPLEAGQRRGLSWLSPALTKISETDQMDDAALASAKIRNLISAAVTAPEGSEAMRNAAVDWVPGAMLPLDPGSDVEFFEPKESGAYGEFLQTHLRAIAVGIGVPYEVLTGDLSEVNYSSIRAGIVEFRKRLQHWQYNIIGRRLLRPVWQRFVTASMAAGIVAPAKLQDAIRLVEWQPPKQEWVDPLKDVQAGALAVDAGFTSRSAIISEMGYDPEIVDAEIAADNERAASLGILQPPAVPAVDEGADGEEAKGDDRAA